MITKADYDELIHARELGAEWAYIPSVSSEMLNIAAAIAEYERAQEGK